MSMQGLLLLFATVPNKWPFLMKRINLVATEALIGETKFRGDIKPELPNTCTCTCWLPTEEMESWHLVPSPWIGSEVLTTVEQDGAQSLCEAPETVLASSALALVPGRTENTRVFEAGPFRGKPQSCLYLGGSPASGDLSFLLGIAALGRPGSG